MLGVVIQKWLATILSNSHEIDLGNVWMKANIRVQGECCKIQSGLDTRPEVYLCKPVNFWFWWSTQIGFYNSMYVQKVIITILPFLCKFRAASMLEGDLITPSIPTFSLTWKTRSWGVYMDGFPDFAENSSKGRLITALGNQLNCSTIIAN